MMTSRFFFIVFLVFNANKGKISSNSDAISNYVNNSTQSFALQRTRRSTWFSCGEVNSCKVFYRKCNCDDLCRHFGDCCWDASPNNSIALGDVPKMSCVNLLGNDWNWVVSDCPDSFKDTDNTRAKCKKDSSMDVHDPEIAVPVWGIATEMAYQNHFCAQCNGAPDVVPFNISVMGFNKGCTRPDTTSPIAVMKHYLRENSSCLIEFLNNNDAKQRFCYSNFVSTCSTDDLQLKERCEMGLLNPMYVLRHRDGDSAIGFRNYHCYACSRYYPSSRLSCFPGSSGDMFPMRVLVDTTELKVAPRTSDMCGDSQTYDPIYVRIFNLKAQLNSQIYIVPNENLL